MEKGGEGERPGSRERTWTDTWFVWGRDRNASAETKRVSMAMRTGMRMEMTPTGTPEFVQENPFIASSTQVDVQADERSAEDKCDEKKVPIEEKISDFWRGDELLDL